jgi:voltage-gated potassium channel
MAGLKKKLYNILSIRHDHGTFSRSFNFILIGIILLNVISLVLETVDEIAAEFPLFFRYFNLFSIYFFTVEYILRVWTITEHPRFRHPVTGRLQFIITPLAIIDLMAFFPYYLPMLGLDLRFVRILRIFRLLRVFHLTRYFRAFAAIKNVFRRKKEELLISLTFVFFILIITSCLMFYVENEAQPEAFSSIPATMWWGVATLTTVGYGDIYPITPLGRVLGSFIAVLGVGLVALPTGILASGFSEEISRHKKNSDSAEEICPTCGQKMPHRDPDNHSYSNK